jgi:hypothetical protein
MVLTTAVVAAREAIGAAPEVIAAEVSAEVAVVVFEAVVVDAKRDPWGDS